MNESKAVHAWLGLAAVVTAGNTVALFQSCPCGAICGWRGSDQLLGLPAGDPECRRGVVPSIEDIIRAKSMEALAAICPKTAALVQKLKDKVEEEA